MTTWAANIIFQGSVRTQGARCRIEMAETGPFVVNMSMCGRRLESRQRAAYRLFSGDRLRKADEVVAACGNTRCLDRRHLVLIRAPLPPKVATAVPPPPVAL